MGTLRRLRAARNQVLRVVKGPWHAFLYPSGIAINGDGDLYVGDSGNHAIRKVSANGRVRTFAGGGSDGFLDGDRPLQASFNDPRGIAIDRDGNLLVADCGNKAIRMAMASIKAEMKQHLV